MMIIVWNDPLETDSEIQYDELHTDALYAFVSIMNSVIDSYIFVDATFLDWVGQEIFRHQARKTVQRWSKKCIQQSE